MTEENVEVVKRAISAINELDDNGKLRRRASFTEPRDALQAARQSE